MNTLPQNEIVVLDVAGSHARVAVTRPDTLLESLGFVMSGDRFERPIADEADRERLIRSLIDLRALFVRGRDWSPAEVADYLRDQGKINGPFRRIMWRTPVEYLVSEE